MGISLRLDIIATSIDPRGWEEVYDESLRLLEAHPARLVALAEEEVRSLKRLVYTRAIERDSAGPRRRWYVVGDHRSGQTAESFELYRDLEHYRGARRAAATERPHDAAVEHVRDLGSRRERSRTTAVLSAKTQGCPYHEPLVAVLALGEDRLGPAAFAHGDITAKEAARACAWASRVLGRRLDSPVCVRPGAVHDRLAPHFEGDALLDACLDLHVGPEHRMLAVLGARTDRSTFERWFAARLRTVARDGNPAQIGVIQLLTAWLDARLDFDWLAAIACTRPEGPRFAPEVFARSAVVARRSELAGGIDARVHAWLSSMGLPVPEPEKRPKRRAWPRPRRLVAGLGRLYPDARARITTAVERAEAELSAQEKSSVPAKKLEPSTSLRDLLPSVPAAFDADGAPMSAAGLLLRSAALAAHLAAKTLWGHGEIGPALRGGPDEAWRVLVGATRGRPLFEQAWRELDAERDVDFLVFVLGLLALADREPNATACRALLWDLPLCRQLQRASADASWRRALEKVLSDLQKQAPDRPGE